MTDFVDGTAAEVEWHPEPRDVLGISAAEFQHDDDVDVVAVAGAGKDELGDHPSLADYLDDLERRRVVTTALAAQRERAEFLRDETALAHHWRIRLEKSMFWINPQPLRRRKRDQ